MGNLRSIHDLRPKLVPSEISGQKRYSDKRNRETSSPPEKRKRCGANNEADLRRTKSANNDFLPGEHANAAPQGKEPHNYRDSAYRSEQHVDAHDT